MVQSFESKVVVITGGGGGIGGAVALDLATQGAKVIINDFGKGKGSRN
jgi:NAD(P)-dependent dehydrogenase (short-subunit alcohol dehydrogenase family)